MTTLRQRPRAISISESEDEGERIAPLDGLHWFNQRYLHHNPFFREKYNDLWYEDCNANEICDKILDKHWFDKGSGVVEMILATQKDFERKEKMEKALKKVENAEYSNWWLITLTSKPEWSEEQAKIKIDKYREAHFHSYINKYVWVEEHGTESEKYHQHILVETTNKKQRFHTGINLKTTKYYDANINIQRVVNTPVSKGNVLKYLTKENQPQGCVAHFYGCV